MMIKRPQTAVHQFARIVLLIVQNLTLLNPIHDTILIHHLATRRFSHKKARSVPMRGNIGTHGPQGHVPRTKGWNGGGIVFGKTQHDGPWRFEAQGRAHLADGGPGPNGIENANQSRQYRLVDLIRQGAVILNTIGTGIKRIGCHGWTVEGIMREIKQGQFGRFGHGIVNQLTHWNIGAHEDVRVRLLGGFDVLRNEFFRGIADKARESSKPNAMFGCKSPRDPQVINKMLRGR